MIPFSTTSAPKVLDKGIKRLYVKGGQRKLWTSDGVMKMRREVGRKLFGRLKGGKYSQLQYADK